jgi:pantetheine-phosphate adenylyltransferase
MTRIAVFPGSFDPMTNAHLDVAGRASGLFDRLVVGVLNNSKKSPLFDIGERVELIRSCVGGLGEHVEVEAFEGLTVDFARRHGAGFIVRGLRAVSDFEAELQMALTNRKLAPEVDTTFLITALEYGYVSSSLAKEVAQFGGDVSAMLPRVVAEALAERLSTGPRV